MELKKFFCLFFLLLAATCPFALAFEVPACCVLVCLCLAWLQLFLQVVDHRRDVAGFYNRDLHHWVWRLVLLNFSLLLSAPFFWLFFFLGVPLLSVFVPLCFLYCWVFVAGPGHWAYVEDCLALFLDYCFPTYDWE